MNLKQYPTKALAPFMLEDNRKVMVDRRGEEEQYSYEDILRCTEKSNLNLVWIVYCIVSILQTNISIEVHNIL